MAPNTSLAKRYEGRLFVDDGRLHLVLDVNLESGTASVSCNDGSGPQVEQWPVGEIGIRLAKENGLLLDGLTRADKSERITQKDAGWFFTSREGLQGPFKTHAQAGKALQDYILTTQGNQAPRH
jgi:hypothetical protein